MSKKRNALILEAFMNPEKVIANPEKFLTDLNLAMRDELIDKSETETDAIVDAITKALEEE